MDEQTAIPLPAEGLQARLSNIERLLGADPRAADSQAAELLVDVPGHPMVLLFQGIARRLAGNTDSAIEVLGPLCEQCHDAPMPHLQLGLAYQEMGNNEAAVQSMRRAVAVNSGFADAWLALADTLTAMANIVEADKAFAAYISLSVNDPRLREAGTALREKRVDEAESLLRSHLGVHPTDVAALCLLADVMLERERMDDAATLLTRCLELAPGYARARQNYAVLLLRQNKVPEALEQSDLALANEPNNQDFRKLRAAILVRLLEYDESISICEKLLGEDPNQPTVWTSLGHMLKSVGRRDECIDAYRKAFELAPFFGEPYWSLANLKTYRIADGELQAMLEQARRADLDDRDRLHFHFAIGKALEDRSEFAESFRHYAQGNALRLERDPYNIEELVDHVHRSTALFSREFFSARADCGAHDADPIFVLGLPRSGSTLVEQILSSHPKVEGTMELPDIAAIASSLDQRQSAETDARYPQVLADLDQDRLRQLGDSYITKTRLHRKLGTPFFVDKMPNNFAHVGLIHLILPNARIIDVRRHPLACGLSLFKEHFARAQNFSYSLEAIGQYYRNYVELMAHFDAVLPGRVHRVIYESLVDDTEAEVRRLLDYCGLSFDPACMSFHENTRSVSTASAEQVRQPIYRQGLDHWRNYEPWLEPLRTQLGPLVDDYR